MLPSSRITTVLDQVIVPFNEADETESTEDLLTILSRDWSISDVSDQQGTLSQGLSSADQFKRPDNKNGRYRKTAVPISREKHIDRYSPRYDHSCYRVYPERQISNLPTCRPRERKDTTRILNLGVTSMSNVRKGASKSLVSSQNIRHRKIASCGNSRVPNPRFRTMHRSLSADSATGSPDFIQEGWKNCAASDESNNQTNRLQVSTLDPANCRQLHTEKNLTAWERWLIQKEKERRKFAEEDKLIKIKNQELADRAKATQEHKKMMAARKWEEWKEMKQKVTLERKKSEEAKQSEQLIRERLRAEEKAVKAKERYSAWVKEKRCEAQRRQRVQREDQLKCAESNRLRLMAAHSAFLSWLERASSKKLCTPVSYGYIDGQLISYYDRSANPKPSFINPNPWIDPLST